MRTLPFQLQTLLLLALAGTATAATAAPPRWDTYANARFGYEVCYPADLLAPQPEATNGDGRVFTSRHRDGAELAAWGIYAMPGDTLASDLDYTAKVWRQKGGQITYRVLRPGWYVVSGQRSGKIMYQKTLRVGDAFKTFMLTYPASAGAVWNPLAARINGCFRSLGSPTN